MEGSNFKEKFLNLLAPKSANDAILLFMAGFMLYTIIQHLVFHTYSSWFHKGNYYFPTPGKIHQLRFRNSISGKSQPRRIKKFLDAQKASDPQKVLDAMDKFGATVEWHPSYGIEKSKIIRSIIEKITHNKSNSLNVAEFGSYAGYMTVLLGSTLRNNSKMYSVEEDSEFSDISSEIFRKAGLSNCQFINDEPQSAVSTIRDLHDGQLDLVLLDINTKEYLPTFIKLQKTGLIGKGTTVIANNAIEPGLPDFLIYVRTAPQLFSSTLHPCKNGYEDLRDGLEEVTLL